MTNVDLTNQYTNPPPDVLLRNRFQVAVTRLELAADQLDRLLIRGSLPVSAYVELARLRDELREIVEQATAKVEPRPCQQEG